MGVLVNRSHARNTEIFYCGPGLYAFFKRHGLDFEAFLGDGIDSDLLLATGDSMAAKAVAIAVEEVEHGRK